MREILFRAKLADEDTWVEGSLVVWKGDTMIYTDRGFPHFMGNFLVEPETVGQYTGLTANGTKIFEGDIVEFEDLGEEGYEYKEGYEFTNRARVTLDNYRVELTDWLDKEGGMREEMHYDYDNFIDLLKHSVVIGNIHDNPELLEGGADNV